jgi:hypothetical protein
MILSLISGQPTNKDKQLIERKQDLDFRTLVGISALLSLVAI